VHFRCTELEWVLEENQSRRIYFNGLKKGDISINKLFAA